MNLDRRTVVKGIAAAGLVSVHSGGPVIEWNFSGGNLEKAEQIAPNFFRCSVKGQSDQDGRNRQANWYFFRVRQSSSPTLKCQLVHLRGEYNYQLNNGAITKDTLPFYSYDGDSWLPVDTAVYEEKEPSLTFEVPMQTDQVWIAHVPPYTFRNFDRLQRELKASRLARVESIGKSVQKRAIPLVTITEPSEADAQKKAIWLMFRQHAWEAGSSWTGEGLMRYAISDDPLAKEIRTKSILKILPLNDPDGVANGGVRFNVNGYDFNRNWDNIDTTKIPEIAAEHAAMIRWLDSGRSIDFFLTLHNDEYGEYLNGPPNSKWLPLLQRTWSAWNAGKTFAPAGKPALTATTTTEGKPGRMNVVQGLSHERGVPAFEVEMRITKHPKLGRRPNIDDRLLAGRELLQAIWSGLNT